MLENARVSIIFRTFALESELRFCTYGSKKLNNGKVGIDIMFHSFCFPCGC